MKNKEYALKYIERGWSIIPVNSKKLPFLKEWKTYQSRRPRPDEAEAWWTKWPDAGIALVCGAISGVIVVDIDAKSGGKDTAKKLDLPITLVSKTGGGGNHYFYKWRKGLVGAKISIAKGVDIRSDASYAIIPPSDHASGNKYEWIIEDEPMAAAPPWLEEKSEGKTKTDWDKFFKENKGEGLRNMSATQLAGKLIYMTDPELVDTVGLGYFREWNKTHNKPSLPDRELLTVWESIKKTHFNNNKKALAAEDEDGDEEDGADDKPVEEFSSDEEEKLISKSFVKNKTTGTYKLAHYLTRKFSIITVGEKEREMYVYRDGMYFNAENEIIFPEVQRVLQHYVTKAAKMETFHKIADLTAKPRSIFESAPLDSIPLKNGVYSLKDDTISPHSPENHFTYQFPVIFDPKATCPKTLAFFDQVLSDDQKPIIQEWLGYYFYRLYSFKKAIIFVGEGDTGKTTLLEVITHLIGRANVASVSLQKMTGDKFAAAHLYEKHGNLVDELSAKDISDTGNFKIATGGGSIAGEYKFGNQFSFLNFAKFTFACNKIPDIKDFDDLAYFNRWMVVRFGKTIEHKIPNFIQTIATEEERSGLFNYAMEGLRRLLEQKAFSYAKSGTETKIEMMKSGSSIAMFCSECLIQDAGAEITKEAMYDAYVAYCTTNGLATDTKKMLGTKLPFYVSYANDGLIYDPFGQGKRVSGWRGVKVAVSKEKEVDVSEKEADEVFEKL